MKGVPFDGTYQIFFFCEAVRSFCEQVMLVKERAQREREKNSQWTNFNRAIWCHEREKLL